MAVFAPLTVEDEGAEEATMEERSQRELGHVVELWTKDS